MGSATTTTTAMSIMIISVRSGRGPPEPRWRNGAGSDGGIDGTTASVDKRLPRSLGLGLDDRHAELDRFGQHAGDLRSHLLDHLPSFLERRPHHRYPEPQRAGAAGHHGR